MALKAITGLLADAESIDVQGESRAVLITPQLAEELLKANDNIRNVKKAVVSRYAIDMITGRWRLTGEPIIFDSNGKLKNGQHRLFSCVQADTPFPTYVVTGVDPDVILDIDAGAKRQLSDFLAFREYKDAKNLAAAIRIAYQLTIEKNVSQEGYSPETLWNWFVDGHEGLVDDLAVVRPFERDAPKGFTRAHMAAIRHAAPAEMLDTVHDFFNDLAYKTATENVNAPVALLRTFMLRFSTQHKGRLQVPERVAVTIKALNLFAAGHETTTRHKIVWMRGKEPFPQIEANLMDAFVNEE